LLVMTRTKLWYVLYRVGHGKKVICSSKKFSKFSIKTHSKDGFFGVRKRGNNDETARTHSFVRSVHTDFLNVCARTASRLAPCSIPLTISVCRDGRSV
jgi:hypothetical protein